ncbi:MAG TPA: hypothetical protein VMR70_05500 [Flavisolibacter sp.]|nr:hypothetical protein [Flavisolibacter sp.]
MKTIILSAALLLAAAALNAQDVITLKTGTTINGKVAEVGINEIKYYKAENLQGPVYVTGKADVAQIAYANGAKDVFALAGIQATTTQQNPNVVVVPQQAPQRVIVERPYRRRSSSYVYPIITPHIDLGHHVDLGHFGGGHHGGGHH